MLEPARPTSRYSGLCKMQSKGLAELSLYIHAVMQSAWLETSLMYTIVPLSLAAAFLLLSTVAPSFPLVLVCLCVAGAGAYSWGPSFWVLPTLTQGESAAAASIGMINIIGSSGSFFGPSIVGFLLSAGFSFTVVVAFLSASFLMSAVLVSAVRIKTP